MARLGFDNTYARELTGMYVPMAPRGFAAPELLHLDDSLRIELGLPDLDPTEAARLFSGTSVADDAEPLAMAYAGHQFGGFSPQLGDGRALLLGEVVDPRGRRWDIQLKGSGPTPFSRGGDGFATVGPMLREHLVSAAMHHLGIPTSRVLATIRTGEAVFRRGPLPGAVLARVASSHLRAGTFQFFAVRGDHAKLERLVAYSLRRHAPELDGAARPAIALLEWVAQRQAELVAAWMGVGFVHGVMNTDNFTLSGETLDYGPCAFLEAYDPGAVFSSIDHGGRYAFGNQPAIAQWNLARLGEALLPLINTDLDAAIEQVQRILADFADAFIAARQDGLRRKLGLAGEDSGDEALAAELLDWMHRDQRDHTSTFRALASGLRAGSAPFDDARFSAWHTAWRARLGGEDPATIAARMDRVNPLYIPRNHKIEEALDAAVSGDLGPFRRLLEVLEHPFEPRPGAEAYAEPAPADFGPYATFCGT